MSTFVVTGASGFLGRHVCGDLAGAGHVAVRVGRNERGELCDLDTGDTASFYDGADGVVHLAGALASGPETPLADYLGPNVAMTEQVLLGAASAGVRRFVFSSSRLVYRSDLGRPATEDDLPAPETAYGLSKWFAERVVAFQAERVGMSATSLRISQLVGVGDGNRGALARFAEAAFAGAPITVSGSGAAVRDVIDVRDAARAVRLAITARSEVPPCLNIGGGALSIRDLAEIAARAAGRGSDAIEHLKVDTEDRSHWSLDTSLARESIGWQPQIDLTASLRHRRAHDADAR